MKLFYFFTFLIIDEFIAIIELDTDTKILATFINDFAKKASICKII